MAVAVGILMPYVLKLGAWHRAGDGCVGFWSPTPQMWRICGPLSSLLKLEKDQMSTSLIDFSWITWWPRPSNTSYDLETLLWPIYRYVDSDLRLSSACGSKPMLPSTCCPFLSTEFRRQLLEITVEKVAVSSLETASQTPFWPSRVLLGKWIRLRDPRKLPVQCPFWIENKNSRRDGLSRLCVSHWLTLSKSPGLVNCWSLVLAWGKILCKGLLWTINMWFGYLS